MRHTAIDVRRMSSSSRPVPIASGRTYATAERAVFVSQVGSHRGADGGEPLPPGGGLRAALVVCGRGVEHHHSAVVVAPAAKEPTVPETKCKRQQGFSNVHIQKQRFQSGALPHQQTEPKQTHRQERLRISSRFAMNGRSHTGARHSSRTCRRRFLTLDVRACREAA